MAKTKVISSLPTISATGDGMYYLGINSLRNLGLVDRGWHSHAVRTTYPSDMEKMLEPGLYSATPEKTTNMPAGFGLSIVEVFVRKNASVSQRVTSLSGTKMAMRYAYSDNQGGWVWGKWFLYSGTPME